MLDPEAGIFCNIYNRSDKGMERLELSPRYTMMTLLGLHRYELAGRRSPISVSAVLDVLLKDRRWMDNSGDLGLLLWTCAELIPDRVPEIYESVRTGDALTRFADGRQGCTMEVAWYLTGLAMCCAAGHGNLPGLDAQIEAARRILKNNCGVAGVYGHRSGGASPSSYIRHRIGSFADQVYPTIAFSRLAQARGDKEAQQMARRTAETMCRLQGPLGEWSWQYDAATGRVVSRYPVYSVHQHAMAPMMLFAASEATGVDFNDAIYKGLEWIGGHNELSRDFIEPELGLVWRCIYLDKLGAYQDALLRFLRVRTGSVKGGLKVRYECRPYELGWLLYAFAGK